MPSRHMTLLQRSLNVDATSWRCIDVEPTLYKRHVPAGMGSKHAQFAHAYDRICHDSAESIVLLD